MDMMLNIVTLLSFLFVSNSLASTVPEPKRVQDVADFIGDIVSWIRDKNGNLRQKKVMKHEDCVIINFGYTKELLYHQLSLSSTSSIRLNLGTHGMNTANRCWIALVAGSHLQHLQSVFNTVELLGTQMQKTAYAVFLLGDSENADFVRNHWTPPVVKIGLKGRSVNILFNVTCQGNWITKTSQLLLKEGSVNKHVNEVCPESLVRVASNNFPGHFELDSETFTKMIRYNEKPGEANDWEIFGAFFHNYNLVPLWIDCNYTWGWYEEEIGWNGAVELVRNNSADLGVTAFGCSAERASVTLCSHSVDSFFDYWNTAAPGPLPPATNIILVFSPMVWGLILLSVVAFSTYMIVAARLGTHFGVVNGTYEDFIVPFRLQVPVSGTLTTSRNSLIIFPRGFSANLVFIVWGLFAAVISYGFLGIFRDILIKPVFSPAVDTAQDVMDRGIIPFTPDGGFWYKEHLLNSPTETYKYLGQISIVPQTYEDMLAMMRHEVHELKTHAYIGNLAYHEDGMGEWHTSKEPIQGMSPIAVLLINKKMPYEEEIQRTILYFDQAGFILSYEMVWPTLPKPLEKIQVAHLFIAFVILGIGIILGISSFLVELCMVPRIPGQES